MNEQECPKCGMLVEEDEAVSRPGYTVMSCADCGYWREE